MIFDPTQTFGYLFIAGMAIMALSTGDDVEAAGVATGGLLYALITTFARLGV